MMLQIKALIADGILEGVKSIAPQSDMTAEEKLAALEGYEMPDPDYSGFVKKELFDVLLFFQL